MATEKRWATLLDGEVILTQDREGGRPPPAKAEGTAKYSHEQIGPDVVVGMKKGAEYGRVAGGFGWDQEILAKRHGQIVRSAKAMERKAVE